MCEEIMAWLEEETLPTAYRHRLAALLVRRALCACAPDPQTELPGIEAEIASLVCTLREYVEALGDWEGEGGR